MLKTLSQRLDSFTKIEWLNALEVCPLMKSVYLSWQLLWQEPQKYQAMILFLYLQ